MKQDRKAARKHRLFEIRQHLKTPTANPIENRQSEIENSRKAALLAWPGNVN